MREREIPTINPRQQEMEVISFYAKQEAMPYDLVEENSEIDPIFDGFFDEYFDNTRDQLIYGFISSQFAQMPRGDTESFTQKFIDDLWSFKVRFMTMPEIVPNSEAASAVREINLENASKLASFLHGKSLAEAQIELNEEKFVSDNAVSKLIYWSKVDSIARSALERLDADLSRT